MAEKNSYERIIEFLNENEFITNAIVRQLLGLTKITTKRLLKKMVEENLLIALGERKARKYALRDKF